jgi:hypothetical protein
VIVFIIIGERHGSLTTNFVGFRYNGFGPELPIGHLFGDYYKVPVLLMNVAFGDKKQGIHWHSNGETYWLVGETMGQAIFGWG